MGLSCAGKCGMAFLIIINIIFMLLGLGLLIPGILVQTNSNLVDSHIKPLLNQIQLGGLSLGDALNGLSITLIIAGCVILVIAALGAFGACCQSKVLLIVYAVIIIVLVLCEITVVALWFVLRSNIDSYLKSELVTSLSSYSAATVTNDTISTAWNYLFISLSCCGVNPVTGAVNDFDSTTWITSGYAGSDQIPIFCCTNSSITSQASTYTACTQSVTTGTYHATGCYAAAFNLLNQYSLAFIITGVIILVVEILCFIFACIICKSSNSDKVSIA